MRPRVIVFITGNAVDGEKYRNVIIVTGNRKWKGVSEGVLLIFFAPKSRRRALAAVFMGGMGQMIYSITNHMKISIARAPPAAERRQKEDGIERGPDGDCPE